MVYTCNMNSCKDGKKVNVICIVDRKHERPIVALDHFRNFKDIQLIVEYNIGNEEGILMWEKKIVVQN